MVQTGAPGQLTSVFIRGLESDQTEVLLDGIPINQGLAGLFDFGNLTERWPATRRNPTRATIHALWADRARRRDPAFQPARRSTRSRPAADTVDVSTEGGSFTTFRERALRGGHPRQHATAAARAHGDGSRACRRQRRRGAHAINPRGHRYQCAGPGVFDYSISASRLDTDNDRPNDQYQNTAALANFGFTLRNFALDQWGGTAPRIGLLVTYSYSATGDPNTIYDP